MILLFLALAGGWGFTTSPQVLAGSAQSKTLEVTLELAPDEGLLVNRLNPPEVSLRSPWKTSPLSATVNGEPWTEHPDVYFSRVNPVKWTIIIPVGTLSGQYEATVSAKLGLCKSDSGFCFVRRKTQAVTLAVTERVKVETKPRIIMKFHAPSF